MHAGWQVRSVTLPPEIQTVFLYPQRQSRRTRHDVEQGACWKRGRERWNVTSTLIYGKSEAILVDCQFRISQANEMGDQILNTRETWETDRRIADSRPLATTIQHPNGTLYASGFAFSLEEERQPKI